LLTAFAGMNKMVDRYRFICSDIDSVCNQYLLDPAQLSGPMNYKCTRNRINTIYCPFNPLMPRKKIHTC